ncbi:MAG: cell division protein FtsZ, partial [Cyanobacteria bacterium J06636_28]
GEVRITVIATGFNANSDFGSTATTTASRITPLTRPSAISSNPSDLSSAPPASRPSIAPDLDIPDFLQRRRQSR